MLEQRFLTDDEYDSAVQAAMDEFAKMAGIGDVLAKMAELDPAAALAETIDSLTMFAAKTGKSSEWLDDAIRTAREMQQKNQPTADLTAAVRGTSVALKAELQQQSEWRLLADKQSEGNTIAADTRDGINVIASAVTRPANGMAGM